jgi:hypothetical protein
MRSRLWAALSLGVLALAAPARAADQAAIDRAIERGVAALKRMQAGPDGTWPHREMGATALAGLTLLECKMPVDDPSVAKAAAAVRRASVSLDSTYSLALSILFLDRLGDPRDVGLIESMTVRLLAGQTPDGGWSYKCPPISAAEVKRLNDELKQRNVLKTEPAPRKEKRTVRDLTPEIRQQLGLIGRMGQAGPGGGAPGLVPAAGGLGPDNSNTQFATLGLWVARRYGLPVDEALARNEARFRRTQGPDGGWGYFASGQPAGPRMWSSTATMTCAGLLGLAVGLGTSNDPDKKGRVRNPDKDQVLRTGLLALGTTIGNPGDDLRLRKPTEPPHIGNGNGKAYYFLWSLERAAVSMDMKTIGKKDWYAWGAEVLLKNQGPDGGWHGEYSEGGADTCFALLFLRRANLVSDLTAILGPVRDPGVVVLRSGGVGGEGLQGRMRPALGPEDKSISSPGPPRDARRAKPIPSVPENARADRLSNDLLEATGAEQDRLLRQLRDAKGGDYTDALALAIPKLEGEARKKARDALATRFTRLTPKTLLAYMKDDDPEVRRAALLASAMREIREHIPALIAGLSDPDPSVIRAAHAALKTVTREDFGPPADATREEHDKAVAEWKAWWKRRGR